MKLESYKINDNLYSIAKTLVEKKSASINEQNVDKIKTIRESIHVLFIQCDSFIKKSKKDDVSIEKCKKLKWKCFKAENQMTEKLALLEKRELLFQSTELPQTPDFLQMLAKIASDYPHLQSGLEHFQHVLKSVMRISPFPLTEEDITRLQTFHHAIQEIENLKDLNECTNRLIDTLRTTLSRKQNFLNELRNQCPYSTPFSEWDEKDKITLLVQAEQILNNPFEPKFDPLKLLEKDPILQPLVLNSISPSKKKNYWDWMPPLERQAIELANTPEKKRVLIQAKTEGLKKLVLPMQSDSSTHLVVGGGPAGLIHALCFKMLGKKFQILEKRKESKIPRPNTVTLGKWETKELEILFFLGAIHRMENQISFGHNRPYYNEIRLGDLEEALLDIIKALNDGINPIQYETTVTSINQANCTLFDESKNQSVTIQPSTVIVADGLQGTTKRLLGIQQVKLAKSTLIHFSIFKKSIPLKARILTSLQYKIKSVAKACLLVIKMIGFFLCYRKSFEETYAMAIDGGPTGLSRVSSQDYLLRVLKKEEQSVIKQTFQDKLKSLQLKMKKYAKNQDKLDALKQKQAELLKKREAYLTRRALGKHGMFDFLHTLYHRQGHQMQPYPMKHTQNFLVDVLISKAERSLIKVGNTVFLIRGDACHTTDPYSGTGCKTALEETLADQYFLRQPSVSNASAMELAILDWGQDHYQQKMIDKGFEERFMYYRGTEKADRFIELAKKQNLISEKQGRECLLFHAKKQHGLPLTQEEQILKAELAEELIECLEKSIKKPEPVIIDDGWKMKEATLTVKEKALFQQITKALIETRQIPNDFPEIGDQLLTIAAKYSCDSDERGPLLFLLLLLKSEKPG